MGGEIFIEAHDVEVLGLPSGAQHLYLVQRDTDGREYVIRSGSSNPAWPFGSEMVVEANRPIRRSEDARDDDTPEERSSTLLEFPELSSDAAWALIVKYAREVSAADYEYRLFDENSNAFVGAMLAAAGGTPGEMLPAGLDRDEAVGFSSWRDIVDDLPPPADGSLRGTAGSDDLRGIQVGERILAHGGDDVVRAGRGDDVVRGGRGDDWLRGGAGKDDMRGGAGDDVLNGGRGDDWMFGGAGADAFVFDGKGSARDRVTDFEVGVDMIRLGPAAEGPAVSAHGSGRHTLIQVGAAQLVLRDVEVAALDGVDIFAPEDAGLIV